MQITESDRAGTEATWTFTYRLENLGNSVAHQVQLHTAYGVTDVPTLMPGGGFTQAKLTVPADAFPADERRPRHPAVERLTFVDPGGTRWRQTGALPEVDDRDED